MEENKKGIGIVPTIKPAFTEKFVSIEMNENTKKYFDSMNTEFDEKVIINNNLKDFEIKGNKEENI